MPPKTIEGPNDPKLNLDQIDEVPVEPGGLPFPFPVVETLIKQAAINVETVMTPTGQQRILQFITPGMVYSAVLPDEVAKALGKELTGSKVEVASMLDLPPAMRK